MLAYSPKWYPIRDLIARGKKSGIKYPFRLDSVSLKGYISLVIPDDASPD
jgi:hypothetical protein